MNEKQLKTLGTILTATGAVIQLVNTFVQQKQNDFKIEKAVTKIIDQKTKYR